MSTFKERLSSLPPLTINAVDSADRQAAAGSKSATVPATNTTTETYPFRRGPTTSVATTSGNSRSFPFSHCPASPVISSPLASASQSPRTSRRRPTLTLRHPPSLSITPIRSSSDMGTNTSPSSVPALQRRRTVSEVARRPMANIDDDDDDEAETWSFLCSPSSSTARVRVAWPPSVLNGRPKNRRFASTPNSGSAVSNLGSDATWRKTGIPSSVPMVRSRANTVPSLASDDSFDDGAESPLAMPTPTRFNASVESLLPPVIIGSHDGNEADIEDTITRVTNLSIKERQLDSILGFHDSLKSKTYRPPTPYPKNNTETDKEEDDVDESDLDQDIVKPKVEDGTSLLAVPTQTT